MPSSLTLPLVAQLTSTTQTGTPAAPSPAPAPAAPVPAPAHPAANVEAPPATNSAQGPTTSSAQSGTATTAPVQHSFFENIGGILPIILMFVVLYLFLFRGQKKEEKRRKQLLAEMKKGDKVQTIGGLVASVVSIDNDEVVLKVDESANVKAVYKKSAILNVITPAGDKKTK